jgi:hypothetical protein
MQQQWCVAHDCSCYGVGGSAALTGERAGTTQTVCGDAALAPAVRCAAAIYVKNALDRVWRVSSNTCVAPRLPAALLGEAPV